MNVDFKANETMKMLATLNCISADTMEGKAITELLQGCNLPLLNENILLCNYAMSLGKTFGANGGK